MIPQELIEQWAGLFNDIPADQKLPLIRMISSLDVDGIDMRSALEASSAIFAMVTEYANMFENDDDDDLIMKSWKQTSYATVCATALQPIYNFIVAMAEHLRKQ
jgi:hypothetical protein